MASPHSESFYCIPEASLKGGERFWYSGLSIVSAVLSLIGSSYTVHTWRSYLNKTKIKVNNSLVANPHIVFSLALADLIACCAVIGRGTSLIMINPPNLTASNDPNIKCDLSTPSNCQPYETYYLYFGVPLEVALRFGYVATYMWTLLYAVDVYLRSKGTGLKPSRYHAISWITAIVLMTINELVVFVDVGIPCAGRSRLIWSYLCMYAPMVLVIVLNPVFYVLSSRNFTQNMRGKGTFTDTERQAIRQQKLKFLVMLLIFYLCWLPSIVNGIYAIVKSSIPETVYMLNAICNPLQGFLNGFAYSRKGSYPQYINPSVRADSEFEYQRYDTYTTDAGTGSDLADHELRESPRRERRPPGEKDALIREQSDF